MKLKDRIIIFSVRYVPGLVIMTIILSYVVTYYPPLDITSRLVAVTGLSVTIGLSIIGWICSKHEQYEEPSPHEDKI